MELQNSQYAGAHCAVTTPIQNSLHRDQISSSAAASGALEGWLRPGWLRGEKNSCYNISILMVHKQQSWLQGLQTILSEHLMAEVNHVRDCEEACVALKRDRVPQLVLTDTKLPDGSWEDILKSAVIAREPVNVLIISRVGNIALYREAIVRGAFDFITPNIPPVIFVQVLKSAAEDVHRRRKYRPGRTRD